MNKPTNYQLSSLLFLLCVSYPVHAARSSQDQAFIAEYTVPDKEFTKRLDVLFQYSSKPQYVFTADKVNFLKATEYSLVVQLPGFPQWIVKFLPQKYTKKVGLFTSQRNIGRIKVAENMKSCIQAHNLEEIILPNKYLYHIPGRSKKLDDKNYLVIAQAMDLVDDETNRACWRNLTAKQEEEIKTIIKTVGYHDILLENIYFTPEGKIVFIDTEPRYSIKLLLSMPVFRTLRINRLAQKGLSNLAALKRELKNNY